jgi:hypothetical protein
MKMFMNLEEKNITDYSYCHLMPLATTSTCNAGGCGIIPLSTVNVEGVAVVVCMKYPTDEICPEHIGSTTC